MSDGVVHPTPQGTPTPGAPAPAPAAPPPAAPAAASPAAAPPATPPAPVDPPAATTAASGDPGAGGEHPKPDGNLLADPLKAAETETPKEGEDAPKDETPAVKPEDYQFTLPDGIPADDPLVAAFRNSAAEAGLTNDAASKVVDALAPALAERLAAPQRAWEAMQATWQDQVKADPEIGGPNLPATVERVSGLLRQFGHPDLGMALTVTGLGNNLALISTLNNLALRLGEGAPVTGGTPPGVGGSGGSAANKLYTSASDSTPAG